MKFFPGLIDARALSPDGKGYDFTPLIQAGLPIAPYIEHGSVITGEPSIMQYGRDPYRGLGAYLPLDSRLIPRRPSMNALPQQFWRPLRRIDTGAMPPVRWSAPPATGMYPRRAASSSYAPAMGYVSVLDARGMPRKRIAAAGLGRTVWLAPPRKKRIAAAGFGQLPTTFLRPKKFATAGMGDVSEYLCSDTNVARAWEARVQDILRDSLIVSVGAGAAAGLIAALLGRPIVGALAGMAVTGAVAYTQLSVYQR